VRLRDLIEEAEIDVHGQATPGEIEIRGLTADLRRVEPGWLFAALLNARRRLRFHRRASAAPLLSSCRLMRRCLAARPVPVIRD
jgi:hypothetical protein